MRSVKQWRWFAPLGGMLGAFLIATAATATELESWRFEPRDHRVTFVTDEAVRPRAQLIFNPTRLVIDLPGVQLGGDRPRQRGTGAIREIRWGQFDETTARLVIELQAGYTLDPEQVQVQGRSPTEWVVQLPEPQPLDSPPTTEPQPLETRPPLPDYDREGEPASELEAVEVTSYGLYLQVGGDTVAAALSQERRDRRIILDLPNTLLADDLAIPTQGLEAFGIEELTVTQDETDPPRARVTLELAAPADWQVNETRAGDLVLQPGRRVSTTTPEPTPEPDPSPSPSPSPALPPVATAQIQAIAFLADRSALQIRTSGSPAYDLERQGTVYRFRFAHTQVGNLPPVDLTRSSRLVQVAWEQEGDDAVVALEVAADVQVGSPTEDRPGFGQRGGDRLILLPLTRPHWEPGSPLPPIQLPSLGNQHPVVVIDPGHGGRDPGAVGIRGLREVDIVNQVTARVRELLEQQGARVVMTRADNRSLELEDRVQTAERANADLFVSVHANAISLSRPEVNGIETFHTAAEGRGVATALLDSLLEATGSPSRGVKTARFYVIRNTTMPSSLVEMGFVTGAEDAPRMETAEYRELLAQAIARGILQYLHQNP